MFGTIPASPPQASTASFSDMRSGGVSKPKRRAGGMGDDDDEDEDDDDDDGDGIALRQGAISLDQAKRITMQSAWRGLRA